MTNGVRTPEDVRAKFRAHYLISGNAYASARAIGLPEPTGADIARELKKDPSFIDSQRALHEDYLKELVNARMRIARKAEERALADEADVYNGPQGITVVDKRKDWADVVLSAEKNAHALAKVEAAPQSTGDSGTALIIKLAKSE